MNEIDSAEETIFNAARQLRDPEKQAAYLALACGGDSGLRRRIESLLRAGQKAKSFLQDYVPDLPVECSDTLQENRISEAVGTIIDRYKLLQKIGEGGCGVVYMAEQEEPVRRRVALKVIKLGMDTKSVVARFEAERQALAMMDHANIAKVLDAGATDTGRPYFVMELVRGVKITDYCDQHKLPPRERLELFVKVCQAIQHAHQKGIIHRDIKPSNILVTVNDGVAVPKVIDFGIAKATEGRLTDNTLFTAFEQFIGTPAYMSPEQAVLTSLDVDTRSDIYSLGVLLYELLTGKTPFDPNELMKAGVDEMRRTIRDQEPPRPSTRLSTLLEAELCTTAANRHEDAPRLINLLRGDLDWIVMKCLEKDRQRRYETANGLAADIQHHLSNEPVVARPPSAAYRLQKMVRRNKLAFAAGASITAALLVGITVSTWQAVVANRARKAADAARAAEARERSAAQTERSAAQTERDRAQAAQAQAEKEKLAAERNAYAAAMVVAQVDWDNANLSHLRQLLNETSTYPDKGFEWYYWQRMCRTDLMTLRDHDAPVSRVCYSPDGAHIASASHDGTVRLWDAVSGRPMMTIKGHGGEVRSVSFSADGTRLITRGNDSTVRIWDATNGTQLHRFRGRTGALAPDGQSVLIGDIDGKVLIREISTGCELSLPGEPDSTLKSVLFSSDGKRMLSASANGTIQVWKSDGASAPMVLRGNAKIMWDVDGSAAVFSPDGQRIGSGAEDRIVRIWDAADGRELHRLVGHGEQVYSVAFSPDGRRVASVSGDRTIKVWDVENETLLFTLKGHLEAVTSIAFSPDGRRLVSGSSDRTIKIWDASSVHSPRVSLPSSNSLQLVRFSPDGQRILTAGKDRTARIWDAATLRELHVLRGHTDELSHANFSPDGQMVSSGGHDGILLLWNSSTGEEVRAWHGNEGTVYWTKVSQDARKILSGSEDGFIRIRDISTGKELWSRKAHEGGVWCVEFDPDERRVASCGVDGVVRVWDASDGRELMALRGHTGKIIPLAFSPDGTKIASGGGVDRTIRVWDTSDGRELLTIHGHSSGIWDLNFSPDGRRLISGAFDKTVRLWDASNGREVLTLRGKSEYVMAAVFSPDGQHLASTGNSPSFEVWDAAMAQEISRWRTEEQAPSERWAAWDRQIPERDRQIAKRRTAAQSELIKSWLILAPIPLAADRSLAQQIREQQVANEADLRPRRQDVIRIGLQELIWKEGKFDDGVIDFNRFLGHQHSSVAAYAVCYVRTPTARHGLRLKIGNDDQARIYLNGKVLYEYGFSSRLEIDRETVEGVDLAPGLNVLVFKVINGTAAWGAALRFVDEEDNPVQGLEFTTTPD